MQAMGESMSDRFAQPLGDSVAVKVEDGGDDFDDGLVGSVFHAAACGKLIGSIILGDDGDVYMVQDGQMDAGTLIDDEEITPGQPSSPTPPGVAAEIGGEVLFKDQKSFDPEPQPVKTAKPIRDEEALLATAATKRARAPWDPRQLSLLPCAHQVFGLGEELPGGRPLF
jgi:hypothetical protein